MKLDIADMINYSRFISRQLFFPIREDQKSFRRASMTKPCSERDFKLNNFSSITELFSASQHSSIIFQFIFNQQNFFHSLIRASFCENIICRGIWCGFFFSRNRINYNLVCLHSIKFFFLLCGEGVSDKQIAFSNLDYVAFVVASSCCQFLASLRLRW